MKHFIITLFTLVLFFSHFSSTAQDYKLVWEDQFNGTSLDSSKWNIEQRIGVWNTGGNNEFQHYKSDNISVGNDGNGNNCLIITAKKESFNGYDYTSGRINTKGKFAFRRGKIEAMIKIPDLSNGLWPAFWTLGYTPTGWPDCGEIDIMEMGHAAGIEQNKQNSYMGAHLFWGPYPSDWGTNYVAKEDLSKGFYKQTAVWTENKISVYFNDASTPYFSMGIDGDNTEEFRNFQHYIIFNLAVGGSVPGISDKNQITAGFPASMYVDWVKVYQETEDFTNDALPLFGSFGIFEEKGLDMHMQTGFDLTENITGLNKTETITPYFGTQALGYTLTAGNNYEIKLTAGLTRNMSNYLNGSVQFYLKTNTTEPIMIGISDQNGNEAFVTLADDQEQNISRDEKWHLAYISLNEIASTVDISKLNNMLIVKGNSSSKSNLAIDEVIYSPTIPSAGYFGIYTNNPNLTTKFKIDNIKGHLYNWSNTVAFNSSTSAFDGEDVLSLKSSGAAAWWGFGIFSDDALNFENFANGYLNLALRTNSTETFSFAIQGAGDTKGEVQFISGKDPYGFIRDGHWHQLAIPMANLIKQGLDLSACGNIFTASGGTIANLGIDDIYLSEDSTLIENPNICYPVSLELLPKNATTKTGRKKQFSTTIKDQFSNKTDAQTTYFSNGGNITEAGSFTSDEAGEFTIWATSGSLSDSTTILVEQSTTDVSDYGHDLKLSYSPESKQLEIRNSENIREIVLYNLSGSIILREKTKNTLIVLQMGQLPSSTYLLHIEGESGTVRKKISNW
ncbi:MAG: T9SS type A sorting domain-containing protein [Prolixibacteraceae bacterium]